MKRTALIATLIAMAFVPAFGCSADGAQTADVEAIKTACLDYVDGFYQSDAARIEKGVSQDLVKRQVANNTLSSMDRKTLIGYAVGQKRTAPKISVEVFDVYGNIALAKVTSEFVDYCQLAKISGKWQVVNVLWVMK